MPKSMTMLTRYKLLDDVRGEVMGVMPRLVHDFCNGHEMVDADAAQREIERLEGELSAMTENRDNWRAQANENAQRVERLEARVKELEQKWHGRAR